jgi:threonine dehydrogenase-like Zn-dependent dehydrogenase
VSDIFHGHLNLERSLNAACIGWSGGLKTQRRNDGVVSSSFYIYDFYLACAASCQLLGAAVVIVGDMIPERLAQARSFGCETIDLRERIPLGERIAQILGVPEADSAVDCVGFEAKGQAEQAGTEQPATVLNSLMALTRAGGAIGIPGLYVTDDPGAKESNAQKGVLGLRIGLGWAKSPQFRNRAVSRTSLQSATYDGHPT